MQVRLEKKEKLEGGLGGGRGASPQSRMTIPVFTSKATGKNICINLSIYIHIYLSMCIYKYKWKGSFLQVCLCVLKKEKREGGLGGGRSASPQSRMTILIVTSNPTCKNAVPPPKQNDNTYFHKQGYKQNISIYFYVYLPMFWCVCIFIYIHRGV